MYGVVPFLKDPGRITCTDFKKPENDKHTPPGVAVMLYMPHYKNTGRHVQVVLKPEVLFLYRCMH